MCVCSVFGCQSLIGVPVSVIDREWDLPEEDAYVDDPSDPVWELVARLSVNEPRPWYEEVRNETLYHNRRNALEAHCWNFFRGHPDFSKNL
jgi:FPC/CPF motif-containing protein YcgG